jgi:hypothetical protein
MLTIIHKKPVAIKTNGQNKDLSFIFNSPDC